MTIMDLNDKREKASRALENLRRDLPENLAAINTKTKGSEHEDKIRALINTCARESAIAAEVISEYTCLLDDIMRASALKWPPACAAVDRT